MLQESGWQVCVGTVWSCSSWGIALTVLMCVTGVVRQNNEHTWLVVVRAAALCTHLPPWGKEIGETHSFGGTEMCIGGTFSFLRAPNPEQLGFRKYPIH